MEWDLLVFCKQTSFLMAGIGNLSEEKYTVTAYAVPQQNYKHVVRSRL